MLDESCEFFEEEPETHEEAVQYSYSMLEEGYGKKKKSKRRRTRRHKRA